MKLAIGSTMRSYKQILAIFQLDINNLPLPEKTDIAKVILSGSYTISRQSIVKKKIGKLTANDTHRLFVVGTCTYIMNYSL